MLINNPVTIVALAPKRRRKKPPAKLKMKYAAALAARTIPAAP
jgi:hypothetical protein